MTVTTPTDTEAPLGPAGLSRPVYLDCSATTPVDPRVLQEVMHYMSEEYGNAGSRTHLYGQVAKERVNLARQQVADVVAAKPDEVIFTSGATESNNLAILGLAAYGEKAGRKHIVSTQIEHKAVLEPLRALADRGFDVTLLPPTSGGWVEPTEVAKALRPQTLLVSVMGVNNETGVIQPIEEIAAELGDHDAYFHVDAAQAFGKIIAPLRSQRIDLISVSGHKIYAPKGVGALTTRRRAYKRPPLQPLQYGGGQERGLRPGTLPVPLIAGLGLAARLALDESDQRQLNCDEIRSELLNALAQIGATYNGDLSRSLPSVLSFSLKSVDSEAAILALKNVAAISNGSACTSHSYRPSHVLSAMGLPEDRLAGALRISWSYLTPKPDYQALVRQLKSIC